MRKRSPKYPKNGGISIFLPTFELRYYKSNQKQLTWKIEV